MPVTMASRAVSRASTSALGVSGDGRICPKPLGMALAVFLALSAGVTPAPAQESLFSDMTELDPPAADGAQEPSLSAMSDGRVLMSWTEPSGAGFAVRTAIGNAAGWSEPRTVVEADDLFVNWADFPSAASLPDGTLAAHWLQQNGTSSYAYDVNIALSGDDGRSWGKTLVPHRDGTQRQHGFVTLLPVSPDRLMTFWLDGRNYDTTDSFAGGDSASDSMELRVASITSDGEMSDETLLDTRTCTCCQTSAVVTDGGTVLVAYRDRTEDEIRDISVLRMKDGVSSEPTGVNADGWRIAGCPVNGPAIDASDGRAAVAWFTAAEGLAKVNVAFSDDDGQSFGDAIGIDQGAPAGRVDVLQLGDGSALVSWLELTAVGEALYACRAVPDAGCGRPKVITISRGGRTIGFPQMALGADGVYIAWTEPSVERSAEPENDTTIRTVLAKLDAVE